MSIRRQTTVHDVANLRVHPDGSRVSQARHEDHPATTSSSLSNASALRAANYVSRDVQGNLIAKDAGGTATIKRKFSKGKGKAISMDDAEVFFGSAGESGSDDESKKDSRKGKRRKFHHDLSFLSPSKLLPTSPPSSQQDASTDSSELPVPSSVSHTYTCSIFEFLFLTTLHTRIF